MPMGLFIDQKLFLIKEFICLSDKTVLQYPRTNIPRW